MKEFEIVAPREGIHVYRPEDISFTAGVRPEDVTKQLEEHDSLWQEELVRAKKEGRILYNGPCIGLNDIDERDGNLAINIYLTDRREHIIRQHPAYCGKRTRFFATGCVVVTEDGYVPILERSDKVDSWPEGLSIPSGGRWGGDVKKAFEWLTKDHGQGLYRAINVVVEDELLVQNSVDEKATKVLGVSFNLGVHDPCATLMSTTEAKITRKDLEDVEKKILSGNKYRRIHAVPLEDLAAFAINERERIPKTIKSAIAMGLAYHLNDEGYRELFN